MNLPIIKYRKVFVALSALLVIGSIGAIVVLGLPLGIDFTGGSLLEVAFEDERPDTGVVLAALDDFDIGEVSVRPAGDDALQMRFADVDEETHQEMLAALRTIGPMEELRFESIGPTIGRELQTRALQALAFALGLIILFIAWAFRKVSRPVSSWKYGLTTIVALAHDIIIPTGIVAVLGTMAAFQVDAFFITALLTILGFSVHDTIVVFDRIRENQLRHPEEPFDEVVNRSLNEVFARSMNTSLTLLFVLLAVFFLGGETTQNLVFVLALGVLSGTYSSLFLASPLLTLWAQRSKNT